MLDLHSYPVPRRPARAVLKGGEVLFLYLLPLVYLVGMTMSFAKGVQGFDFQIFYRAGSDILHGRSPYPHTLPPIAHRATFGPFVYPAPAAVAMVPFALLPFRVAQVLFAVTGAAAFTGALRMLGVRDWRCYGVALITLPVSESLTSGTITPLLVLGVAVLWCKRESPRWAGASLAAVVVAKVFLWPLGFWLLATRRLLATAWSVAFCLSSLLLAWAVLGFAGMHGYPTILAKLSDLVGPQSYSLYALGLALGFGHTLAHLFVYACGLALLALVVAAGRRPGGDYRAFTLALGLTLVVSPVVWPHYLALLFVPLAIARPRFDKLWLVPLLLWLSPHAWGDGKLTNIFVEVSVTAVLLGLLAYGGDRQHPAAA